MIFCGSLFDVHPHYQSFRTLMMDFFRGQTIENMEIDGLQHIVCLSVGEQQQQFSTDSTTMKEDLPSISFRVYVIRSKKVVGSKFPLIELEEMGPRMDFKLGRWRQASEEMMSMALKKPKETVVQNTRFIFLLFERLTFCRLKRRRTSRLILLGINWDGFMLVFRI